MYPIEGAVKFRTPKRLLVPATIEKENSRLLINFRYNEYIKDEIKAMDDARWHGFDKPVARKLWSVKDSPRNRFQLAFLTGTNVYAHYDKPLEDFKPRRSECYKHQIQLSSHFITRRHCIGAAEMGVGKTLAAIEAVEWFLKNYNYTDEVMWVGPKSALASVQLEFWRWQAHIVPEYMTYEGMVKRVETWEKGKPAPKVVVFDECSRVKNPTSQRGKAARYLADCIREEHGYDSLIILMSGSPAPKSPVDWWNLCEIVCPGFVREGNPQKFHRRLGLIVQAESFDGGAYPKLVTWWDDEKKCKSCGAIETDYPNMILHPEHNSQNFDQEWYHPYEKSENEISKLYRRMNGLVLVQFKKDCFSGNVEVLTKQGVRKISDLAKIGNADLYVKTKEGMQWINCPIKSFGKKITYPLRFGDGTEIRTTRNHHWLTVNKCEIENRKKFTFELREGKTQIPMACIDLPEINWEGVAHGFVYGDGNLRFQNNKLDAVVPLHGNDVDLQSLLMKYGTEGYITYKSKEIPCIYSLNEKWKALPENPDKSYALGFILGLFQADGYIGKKTNIGISQADIFELEKIRNLAIFAGLRCQPIRLLRAKSPFDNSDRPLYGFSISTYNLNPEMLLRKDYKKKLMIRNRKNCTTVKSIDWQNGQEEETYCAIVPEHHNFTLANGVITSNCLDLPEKIYRRIVCKPSESTLRAMQLLLAGAQTTIQGLTLCRELSDGFQYVQTKTGESVCPVCHGTMEADEYFDKNDPESQLASEELTQRRRYILDENGDPIGFQDTEIDFGSRKTKCDRCENGKIPTYSREIEEVECPKENAVIDLLDMYEEEGRVVFWGGFTGSINRLTKIIASQGWEYIRVDGRGWSSNIQDASVLDLLKIFQHGQNEYPKVAFIGQPGAGGMGLNLTASSMEAYYSNTFNYEDRSQSEERIYRPGADHIRGVTIWDIVHLPTDITVLQNLQKKSDLQRMTLGVMKHEIEEASKMIESDRMMI